MNVAKRIALLAIALGAGASFAADWPQYRGPNHDGSTPETGILKQWPKEGPKVLWKVPLGVASFGSFAVSNNKSFVFLERNGDEVCAAFDEGGKELWATPIDKTIAKEIKAGRHGPRSTPTVNGGRVYVLGTFLKLACLNADDGKPVWTKDLAREFGGQMQLNANGISAWGIAASPVLDGGRIFVHGGGANGALLALDKDTGNAIWKSTSELTTHASPTPATIHGVRQVVFFCISGLVSVKAEDGAVLWKYPFNFNTSTASSPIVYNDIVYCSAGYGVGSGACQVVKTAGGFDARKLWFSDPKTAKPGEGLMNHWTTPVCKDGFLYGIYGFKQFGTSPLKCIEIATGKERWSQNGFGSGGGTILVDGHILVQGDEGPLVLVEAKPDAYKEVARAQPLGGANFWTMAVVSNGRIYARNRKEGICLDVSGK